jgi:acetolactate synthase-1/2/3 large subunit
MGKGCVDENLPEFIGTATLSENDYIHSAIDRSDLIINVGHDVVEKPPFFMEYGEKKVIHINFSSAIVDNVYFPQLEVVGNIASSIERLTTELGCLERNYSYFARVKKELYTRMNKRAQYDSFPMKLQRFVADVRKTMPSNGIIALNNGIYKV